MKQTLITILISLLLFPAYLKLVKCKSDTSTSQTKIEHRIDTEIIYFDTTIYKDKISYIKDTTYILPPKIDTQAILVSYFQSKYYFDTIVSGKNKVYINDTISQNEIKGRSVRLKLENTIITDSIFINKTITKDKFNFLIGGSMNSNKTVMLQGMLIYNKYGMSVGIDNNLNYQVGIIIKIK